MHHAVGALAAILTLSIAAPLAAQGTEGESQQRQAQDEQKKAKKPRPSRNLITREQIDAAVANGATSAYEVIQRVRRDWFRVRPAPTSPESTALSYPAIFIDNTMMGLDPELLRQYKPEEIKEIRFLSGPDAATRYGSGYPHGIIQVVMSL